MLNIAMELIKKYKIECYKKNEKDKLYSFIFHLDNKIEYDDLIINRIICQTYRLTTNQLREVKRYLRLYCPLTELNKGED